VLRVLVVVVVVVVAVVVVFVCEVEKSVSLITGRVICAFYIRTQEDAHTHISLVSIFIATNFRTQMNKEPQPY